MGIEEVAEIVRKIAEGFEEACVQCLDDNSEMILYFIKEQLYSGQDSEGKYLNPTYSADPYFKEAGYWYNRSDAYKSWKNRITPPVASTILGLSPRPEDVPNLFIDGTFYSQITASRKGDVLSISPGNGKGPDIVSKFGDQILNIGPTAIEYFNTYYLIPAIESFFNDCGYR